MTFYLQSAKKLPEFDPNQNALLQHVIGFKLDPASLRQHLTYNKYTGRTQTPNQRKRLPQDTVVEEKNYIKISANPKIGKAKIGLMNNMSSIIKQKKPVGQNLEEAGILIARGFNPSRHGPRVQMPRGQVQLIVQNHRQLVPKRLPSSIPVHNFNFRPIERTSSNMDVQQESEEADTHSPVVVVRDSKRSRYTDAVREDQYYTFYVGSGNNGELVKRIMSTRANQWKQTTAINSIFNFKWQQSSANIKFDRLNGQSGIVQIVNHFPNHKDISDKSNLIQNLKLYCDSKKTPLFEITPLTFVVDLASEDAELQLYRFGVFFLKNMPKSRRPENYKKLALEFRKHMKPLLMNQNQDTFAKNQGAFSKPRMHPSFESGDYYLWLLKPSDFNRGRGIQLFDSLDTLEKLLVELKEGVAEYTIQQEEPTQYKIKSQEFVIQKYIQKPLLIKGRKFDIRVWVLITHQLNCYFFKEGYLRTSCEPFQMDNIENAFIHLTNNAVQKQSQSYGQFEDGNQLSFDDFDSFLRQNGHGDAFYERMLPQMKSHIAATLLSVKKNFNVKEYKYCFEVFGYDFIVDDALNMWLIEVNTNPCIEESSPLLQMIIPRMINDAFKQQLVVHQKILPKLRKPPPKESQQEAFESIRQESFHVAKHGKDNMWEYLLTLQNPLSPQRKSK